MQPIPHADWFIIVHLIVHTWLKVWSKLSGPTLRLPYLKEIFQNSILVIIIIDHSGNGNIFLLGLRRTFVRHSGLFQLSGSTRFFLPECVSHRGAGQVTETDQGQLRPNQENCPIFWRGPHQKGFISVCFHQKLSIFLPETAHLFDRKTFQIV